MEWEFEACPHAQPFIVARAMSVFVMLTCNILVLRLYNVFRSWGFQIKQMQFNQERVPEN